MAYYEKDGFHFDGFRDNLLIVESDRIEECKSYALANDITGFFFSDDHAFNFNLNGYTLTHLDFLNDERLTVKKLLISSDMLRDINPLNELSELEHLDLTVPRTKCKPVHIHQSSSTLTALSTNFFEKLIGRESLHELEVLATDFNLPEKDLRSLKAYPKLKELNITGGSSQSLDGIENCPNLELVEIWNSSSLRNLNALWMLPNLREVIIDSCKKISVSIHSQVPSLERLVLRNSGEIESISSIQKNATKLKSLNIWGTKVLNADLTPLLEMPLLIDGFVFKNHKNYNLKQKQAEELFGEISREEILELKKRATPITPSGNKAILPTETWKEDGYPEQHQIKLVDKELKRFVKSLDKTSNADERLKVFEISVKNIDKIQVENDVFIDTELREQLVAFYNEVAQLVGITDCDDITRVWREEW